MNKYNFAAETLIEKNKDYIDAIAKTEACLNDGYSIELFKNPGRQESLKVPPFAERIRSFKKVNDTVQIGPLSECWDQMCCRL